MLDPQLLADVDLFRSLSPDAVQRVVAASAARSLRRGDVLFQEDDDGTELFVVESGRIAIANRSPDGRESVVALMEPGDLFGEMSLFDGLGRSAHARALETSVVHAIPFRAIREELEADPELLWGVVEMLARRLRNMDNALADAVFLDVTGRTAKRLLELAGDADEFLLPVTQEELAGLVGASRERVNKALASFIRLGWVEQRDRRYTITDREQLTRRAR
ncbi:MAG: putative Crp family transcriptional regulator [Actinomycetia bacterium]|nr:putative Crp family transcriptional regulator [Actinomycetes bacterium]